MNGLTDCVDVRRRADDDDDDDDAFWQDSVHLLCPSHNPCTAVKHANSNGRFFPHFGFQETKETGNEFGRNGIGVILTYGTRSGKKTESSPSLPVRGETRNERRARVRAPPHVPPQFSPTSGGAAERAQPDDEDDGAGQAGGAAG